MAGSAWREFQGTGLGNGVINNIRNWSGGRGQRSGSRPPCTPEVQSCRGAFWDREEGKRREECKEGGLYIYGAYLANQEGMGKGFDEVSLLKNDVRRGRKTEGQK